MKLTAKQSKFVDAFVELGNATKAALEAGYSKRSARQVGANNMSKHDIKRAIDERMQELESHKIAKADEVLQFLSTVLRGEATETITVGTGKGAVTVDDSPPTIRDRMAAGKELLKRYPDSDDLLEAQIRRAKADADIAEGRAAEYEHNTDGNDYKLIVDVPDKEDGKHEED